MATSLGMLMSSASSGRVAGAPALSQAILLETFPVAERGMAMAIWGIGVIIAPIVGPVMGGWVTDNLTWRWAFYINLPIGLLSLILTYLFIFDPDYIRRQRAGSIDYWGLAPGGGPGGPPGGAGQRGAEDWFSSAFITRLVIIAAVAAGLIYHESKPGTGGGPPALPRSGTTPRVTIMFFRVCPLRQHHALPLRFLQTLMGYDAALAGWALAFRDIGSLLIMPVVGRLTMVMDSRKIVFAGLLINAYAVIS
jgi:DHA2 family multidrug resistance protein